MLEEKMLQWGIILLTYTDPTTDQCNRDPPQKQLWNQVAKSSSWQILLCSLWDIFLHNWQYMTLH